MRSTANQGHAARSLNQRTPLLPILLVLVQMVLPLQVLGLGSLTTLGATRPESIREQARKSQSVEAYDLSASASSIVILAQTSDMPGQNPPAHFQGLMQEINQYYAHNSYGSVAFDVTFMGSGAWYDVAPSLAAYAGREEDFARAALQAAFTRMDFIRRANLLPSIHLARVIVIYAEASRTADAMPPLRPLTFWFPADHYIQFQGPAHVTRVYVPNLVLISEQEALGIWVHELGHTLYARPEASGSGRIADRYNYSGQQGGRIGPWDVMGDGMKWGHPEGSSPTHMSSYTKEAAGWLHYVPAQFDTDYNLTALEHQQVGDEVLRLDDPLSDDPRCFYIIEARDSRTAYGAPESGVVIYHVTYDEAAGHVLVEAQVCQGGFELTQDEAGRFFQRSTLYGVNDPAGTQEYLNAAAGFKVTLRAESFTPYRATIRIEPIR